MKIFENIAHTLREQNSKRNAIYEQILSDSKPQSEIELYFSSISKTVEKLNPIEQAKLKIQISQIVSKAELEHLERIQNNINSQQISGLDFLSFEDESTFTTMQIPLDSSNHH